MASFTYVDLIEWSESLPHWQRDALRRVLAKSELTEHEIHDLVALAKAPHDPDAVPLNSVPASEDHVQPEPITASSIRLVRIRDIGNVNALGEGPVPFGATDLTVVYGGNGSGKSGIARILKKTCLARDDGGSIRPNVFKPTPSQPPNATIDFLHGEELRSYVWIEGRIVNRELRLVNVFDDACAAVQVNEQNLITYTPAILQIFQILAEVVDRVAVSIKGEKTTLGERTSVINEMGLPGDTAAGRFINSLGVESKPSELDQLCAMTEQELTRLGDLERALAENPLEKVPKLVLQERKIAEIETMMTDAWENLSDTACEEFDSLVAKRRVVEDVVDVARKSFNSTSILTGVGTEVWKALWESARRYSETHAFKGEAFPVVREGALCVLCQQVLDTKAALRLHSFEEFVTSDIEQQAEEVNSRIEMRKNRIYWLRLPTSVRSILVDTGLYGTPTGEDLRRFLICAKLRGRYLFRVSNHQRVGPRPSLQEQLEMQPEHGKLHEEIARLRAASQAETRLSMERDLTELKTRMSLSKQAEAVKHEIKRMQELKKLDLVLTDCRTQAITLKAREVANTIITNRLRSSFSANLSQIGFSETPVEMMLGPGDHGKHPYEMKLMSRPDVPPEEVLSEGERRCVALAGFLAELETTENYSGIVLDDPVSSLDHRYRKRVAERLIREGKFRQVIIFTHDIVFLYLLRKYSRELSVSVTEVSLEQGYKGAHGRAKEGPPWVAMTIKQRIGRLRNDLVEANQFLKNGDRTGYEFSILGIYRSLRQSWERAVEEVLLYETVLRFGDAIQTQRLSKLTDISDADVEMVTKEMSRCSDFVHDEAGAVYADIPNPDVVESDIARLDDWVKALRSRRK